MRTHASISANSAPSAAQRSVPSTVGTAPRARRRPPAPTGAPLPAGRAARCDRIHDRSIMNARMRSIEYNVARTIKLHTRFGQAAHPARSAPLGAPAGAKDMAWRGCSALPCLAAGRAWCECTHIDQENACIQCIYQNCAQVSMQLLARRAQQAAGAPATPGAAHAARAHRPARRLEENVTTYMCAHVQVEHDTSNACILYQTRMPPAYVHIYRPAC